MSHGVPVTVRPEEVAGGTVSDTAGGTEARVEHLAAKLAQQEEAMAALKKELAELRRGMAKVAGASGAEAKVAEAKGAEPPGAAAKGAAAKGALETGSHGETAKGKNGAEIAAAGEAGKAGHDPPADILDGKEIVAIVENFITEHVAGLRGELASQAEVLQQQVDAVRSEAADAAGALKAEIARIKAAAERQAAEVAYPGGGAGAQAGAEMPEGKRRKLDEAGKAEEVASAAAGGRALVANRGSDGKRDEREIKAAVLGLQKAVDGLLRRVAKVEDGNRNRGRLWEALLTLWAKAAPQQAEMEFIVVSSLSNTALSRLTSLRQLTSINLRNSSGFSAMGVRQLYSLPALEHLELTGSCTDAALEGIDRVTSLRSLVLNYSKVTNAGLARLEGMTSLLKLYLGGLEAITSDGMFHLEKLTALEELSLHETGVGEDGLSYLTSLTSLITFYLPLGVTDSGMKYLRHMQRLEMLGLWDAEEITANGVNWLMGLPCLRKVGTDDFEVEGYIQDRFPGVIVLPGLP
ncbi:unnamed protein product [Closterium sp. NIES-65]|nr:unnamed protein product [Closterium sp. NIES-65]